MSVTIKEIAAQEGVSPTTVFRALHNQTRISPETRERISEKAKQLTYKDLISSKFSEDAIGKILTEARKPVAFFAETDWVAAKTITKAYGRN